MTATQSHSLDALAQFLDTAAGRGWLPANTAGGLKSACTRVLSILDDGDRADIRGIDIEAALHRFANLNPEVSPDSLRTYRARLSRAIEMFTQYRADPVNWRPGRRSGESRQVGPDTRATKGPGRPADSRVRRSRTESSPPTPATTLAPERAGNLTLPYPLRTELTVQISNLPRDFKLAEAERLAAFLRSLAADFCPPGSIP